MIHHEGHGAAFGRSQTYTDYAQEVWNAGAGSQLPFSRPALVYMDEVCLSLGTLIGWKALVLLLPRMFLVWLLHGSV